MPLIFDGDRVPKRWVDSHGDSRPVLGRIGRHANELRIAFINNMPDPALEDTEFQFFSLLSEAAGDMHVRVTLFSLPGVSRTGQAQQHVADYYSPISALWNGRFDAAIITGTEPRQSNLRDEPYWSVLAEVFDWAAQTTSSTMLSCLAAHASGLHSDGIERHRMNVKCSGVFEVQSVSHHPLFRGVPGVYRIPHSRWNELREQDLIASGYTVLTRSSDAGVDSFAKTFGNSLFLHFQGHPEYDAQTLFKEYRRDVKRFLRRERDDYPTMPHGYFNEQARVLLGRFQERAQCERDEAILDNFPQAAVEKTLQKTWDSASHRIYTNWLRYLLSRKTERQCLTPVARISRTAADFEHRKRSAAS